MREKSVNMSLAVPRFPTLMMFFAFIVSDYIDILIVIFDLILVKISRTRTRIFRLFDCFWFSVATT